MFIEASVYRNFEFNSSVFTIINIGIPNSEFR